MSHNPDPDKPSGLISPPPGDETVVKEEPEDEDAPIDEVSVMINRKGKRGNKNMFYSFYFIFVGFWILNRTSTDKSGGQ